MKHGVIMVFILILALCSMGFVSADENITVSCDDTQILANEEIQMDSIENEIDEDLDLNEDICSIEYYELEDNFNSNEEIQDSPDLIYEDDKIISGNVSYNLNSDYKVMDNAILKLNQDLIEYNVINGNINYVEYSDLTTDTYELEEELLDSSEFAEINNKTTENIFNEKYDSSNGYVTKNNGNLLPLIETNLNSETNESLMIKNHGNMKVLSSKNDLTDNYWNSSLITGLSSNRNVALIKKLLLAGFMSNQTTYNNYPQIDLPLDYASNELLGVSRDFDDDAFIWYNPDKEAFVTVDMVNKSTDEILDFNLNEDMNSISPFEIGVNASLKALNYFNSQGINIQKGYPYLYVLTSAGQVKINNANTLDAIYGIMEVFGYEINKNIYSLHIPLWKDLIFYYVWMNSTNMRDTISYGLKYDINSNELIESDEIVKQGNSIIYDMFFKQKKDFPPDKHYPSGDSSSHLITDEFFTSISGNLTDMNSTNRTSNVTAPSSVEKIEESVKNALLFNGNPYNILFTLIAIIMVSTVFGASYSKRKE